MKKCFLVLVILMCLFTISVNAQSFSDVNVCNWFYDNIISAVEKGYIQGYEDGTFRPNEKITQDTTRHRVFPSSDSSLHVVADRNG